MKFVKNAETFRKCEKVAKEKRVKLWKDWKSSAPQVYLQLDNKFLSYTSFNYSKFIL